MEPLPGDPAVLANRADDLSASARAIQDAAEALFGLGFAGSSDAVDFIAGRAADLAGEVSAAHERYAGTAAALVTYAVELQAAHDKADEAASDLQQSIRQAEDADDSLGELRRRRDSAEDADPADPSLSGIGTQITSYLAAREQHELAQQDAWSQYAQAQQDLDEAAEKAIRRIDSALSNTNDGFWDRVGDFFSDIGDFLATVAEWVGKVLKTIVMGILIAIAAVVALLIVIVLIGALLAWIALVFPLLAGIGALLLLSFLVPGLESWRTQLLAALISVAVPLVGGLLLWRIMSDLMAPDPTVTPLDPSVLTSDKAKDAQADAVSVDELSSLDDYMEIEGLTDSMGGEDRSVVDIRKVIGPDGVERWVVTLPSTQDWVATHGDTGATNDLDSNLALMLTPAEQTQYERAIMDAMKQADIPPTDPVMLVGFSQGGIMAGHLAANRSGDYNIEAVLAYGAPIDAMNIPSTTQVLSVQHTGDVVPMLDLTDPGPNTSNHVTVQVDAHDGTIGVGSHSNDKYQDTAANSSELDAYEHYFDDFSGTVVDQHQYTWQEQ